MEFLTCRVRVQGMWVSYVRPQLLQPAGSSLAGYHTRTRMSITASGGTSCANAGPELKQGGPHCVPLPLLPHLRQREVSRPQQVLLARLLDQPRHQAAVLHDGLPLGQVQVQVPGAGGRGRGPG